MNKTVLPMMHGFYSFGTLFGAGVGMAVTGFGLPAAPHIPGGCAGGYPAHRHCYPRHSRRHR